jgi:ribonuclease VapC
VIIDPSVLVALLRNEPDSAGYEHAMRTAPARQMSAASYVELAAVIDGARNPVLSAALDPTLDALGIGIVPFSVRQAEIARDAYRLYGRASGHPAKLNMGDCFSYALARDLGEPLLFKGRDFALTDIELIVQPVMHRRLSEILAAYGPGAAS